MLNQEYRADRRERQDVGFRFPDARCARAALLDIEPYTRQLIELLEEVSARAAAPPPTGVAYTPPPLHSDKRDARQEKQRHRALVPTTWRERYDLYDAFCWVNEDWRKRIDQALSRVEMAEHQIDNWNLPREERLSQRIAQALKALAASFPPPTGMQWDPASLPPCCVTDLKRRIESLDTLAAELDAPAEEVGTPEPDEPWAASPLGCPWTYPNEQVSASEEDRIELRRIRERVKCLLDITGVRSAFESGRERFNEIAREATADVARVELAHWNRAKTILKEGGYRYRRGELQEDCPELRRECTWVTVRGCFNPKTFCEERSSELARDVHAAMNASDAVRRAPSARGTQQRQPPPCQKVELTEVRIAIRPLKLRPPRVHPIRAKWRDLQEYPELDRVAVAYALLGALHDSQSLLAPLMDTAVADGVRPMEDPDLLAKLHWRTLMPVEGEDTCGVPALDPSSLTPDFARQLYELVTDDLVHKRLICRDSVSGSYGSPTTRRATTSIRSRRPGAITPAGAKGQTTAGMTQKQANSLLGVYFDDNKKKYSELVQRLTDGDRSAIGEARDMFGRNSLTRRLKIRSGKMVSQSPIWKDRGAHIRGLCENLKRAGKSHYRDKALAAAPDTDAVDEMRRILPEIDDPQLAREFALLGAEDRMALVRSFQAGNMPLENIRDIVFTLRSDQKDTIADQRRRRK